MSVDARVSMEEARARLEQAIAAVDDGDGVLVLTDMFGGTPANLALTFLDARVEVVTGVNLPMVVKLSTLRGEQQPLAGPRRGDRRLRREEHHPRQRAAPHAAPPVILLVRIDNRLIHGQILEAWVPRLAAREVLVADDEAAGSPLARAALTLCVPPSCRSGSSRSPP